MGIKAGISISQTGARFAREAKARVVSGGQARSGFAIRARFAQSTAEAAATPSAAQATFMQRRAMVARQECAESVGRPRATSRSGQGMTTRSNMWKHSTARERLPKRPSPVEATGTPSSSREAQSTIMVPAMAPHHVGGNTLEIVLNKVEPATANGVRNRPRGGTCHHKRSRYGVDPEVHPISMHSRQVSDVHEEERAHSRLYGKGQPPLSRQEADCEQRQDHEARPPVAGDAVIQDQRPEHRQKKPDGPEHLYAEDGARKGSTPVQRAQDCPS